MVTNEADAEKQSTPTPIDLEASAASFIIVAAIFNPTKEKTWHS